MTESPISGAHGVSVADARAALDAVQARQLGVRERLTVPRGYDAVYGVASGMMVLGVALSNAQAGGIALKAIGLVLLGVGIGTLVRLIRWFRDVNGMRVSGVRPARAWSAGVVLAVAMVLASLASHGGGWALVVVTPVVAALLAGTLSRLWLTVYRAETRG